jgi:hypothetical protein
MGPLNPNGPSAVRGSGEAMIAAPLSRTRGRISTKVLSELAS